MARVWYEWAIEHDQLDQLEQIWCDRIATIIVMTPPVYYCSESKLIEPENKQVFTERQYLRNQF